MYHQTAKGVNGTKKMKNRCVYIKKKYLCDLIYKIVKRTSLFLHLLQNT